METCEDPALFQTSLQAGVESSALLRFLPRQTKRHGIAGQTRCQLLLLVEGIARRGFRLGRNLIVRAGAIAQALHFFLDGALNRRQTCALLGDSRPAGTVPLTGLRQL